MTVYCLLHVDGHKPVARLGEGCEGTGRSGDSQHQGRKLFNMLFLGRTVATVTHYCVSFPLPIYLLPVSSPITASPLKVSLVS